jgi:DNA invertase Pin-like site-specific DNA recombinase
MNRTTTARKAEPIGPALAFSYIRFSTPQQKLGDSLRRQVERTAAYCSEHHLRLDESLRDEGLSGYHGQHRKRGALGRFIERVKRGEIPTGSVLIVEAFDRLDRRTPREAQEQFLSLINAGVEIVTLIDQQRFSKASIDANPAQLFMSVGMMMGAHASSKYTADRIRETWIRRRGTARTMVPAWIVKTDDKLTLDPAKTTVIRRIFHDILTKGTDLIAKELNAEGVPLLCQRKRERIKAIWNRSTIQKLVRGRQVLGYQQTGRMIDGLRTLSGEMALYPAVVTEIEWNAAQAAIDGRKSGPGTGRNVANYTNLFGHLARCAKCGDRLKIAQRSRTGEFKYLACSSSLHRRCDHTKYHRTDKIEADVFRLFSGLSLEEDWRTEDAAPGLVAQLDRAKRDAMRMQNSLDQMAESFADAPASIKASMAKLASQHTAKLAEIRKLEGTLAAARTAKPAADQMISVQGLSKRLQGLSGAERVEARRQIALALPSLLTRLTLSPDGTVTATLATGREIVLGDDVNGHATPHGFQIGPTVARVGTPVTKVSAEVPYRHPTKVLEIMDKAVKIMGKRSAEALAVFQNAQTGNGTKKRRDN